MINRKEIRTAVKRIVSYRPDVKVRLTVLECSLVLIDFPGTTFLDLEAINDICRELTWPGAGLIQIRATKSGSLQLAISFISLIEQYKYTPTKR